MSISTIRRQFTHLIRVKWQYPTLNEPVNLIADATYFSRSDGVLVFRANKVNIDISFIRSETNKNFTRRLNKLDEHGYRFKSVTLDGKISTIKLFEARYPGIPIQLCQFHQKQIIRRYITTKPQTVCAQALQRLMKNLKDHDECSFTNALTELKQQHHDFLQERNDKGNFKHRKVRSAIRSLTRNLPYLFAHKKYPELGIPNTTNSCDGSFGHWKYKVELHRGLKKYRRNRLIIFLLNR